MGLWGIGNSLTHHPVRLGGCGRACDCGWKATEGAGIDCEDCSSITMGELTVADNDGAALAFAGFAFRTRLTVFSPLDVPLSPGFDDAPPLRTPSCVSPFDFGGLFVSGFVDRDVGAVGVDETVLVGVDVPVIGVDTVPPPGSRDASAEAPMFGCNTDVFANDVTGVEPLEPAIGAEVSAATAGFGVTKDTD